MTEMEKIFYCDRLYAYAMQSLKKNQDILKRMQERGSNTTQVEIEIELAEYALGMREDKPKSESFQSDIEAGLTPIYSASSFLCFPCLSNSVRILSPIFIKITPNI